MIDPCTSLLTTKQTAMNKKPNTSNSRKISRRTAGKGALAWAGSTVLLDGTRHECFAAANERPRVGVVGTGSRWFQKATGIDRPYGSAPEFKKYGDYVAVCDADSFRVGLAGDYVKEWTGTEPVRTTDYRKLIDSKDIDIIHIVTPEHWHAKVAIEAMLAGKDVYCEKPMTLTIEEGQLVCEVAKKTGRVMQIGTQQRSMKQMLTAIALIRAGRLGEIKKATCSLGGGPTSPVLPKAAPPKTLDWELWQGPVAQHDYRQKAGARNETSAWSRSHYEFRWWYEYSGGKLTDWGAHHCDIATWGLGKTETGPVTIDPIDASHPVEFKDGYPTDDSQYNTAAKFQILSTFADGVELELRSDGNNGILFEGTKGRIFVNRGRVTGKPVEDLKDNPLPADALKQVYKHREPTNHFQNFFESVRDGVEPISDVNSHHRALSTCHLSAIAIRLGRKLQWDPNKQVITGDEQAASFIARERREKFEIEM